MAQTTSDFEAARARWESTRLKKRDLDARLRAARSALDAIGIRDRDTIAPSVRAKIDGFLAGRRMTADSIGQEITRLEAEAVAFQDEFLAEAQRWQEARAAEAARRTATARPAHQEIAGRIVAAVQELSDACADEAQLLSAVVQVGGDLPPVGLEFGHLGEPHSLLSRWRSRVAAAGVV